MSKSLNEPLIAHCKKNNRINISFIRYVDSFKLSIDKNINKFVNIINEIDIPSIPHRKIKLKDEITSKVL